MAFNKIILQGRLVRDPEIRQTTSGTSVANFTLAVDRGYGEEKRADFIPVVAFSGTADLIQKYVVKGQQIIVSGSLQQKYWEDKDGNKRTAFEVLTHEIAFCEGRPTLSANASTEEKDVSMGNLEPVSGGDDLPF